MAALAASQTYLAQSFNLGTTTIILQGRFVLRSLFAMKAIFTKTLIVVLLLAVISCKDNTAENNVSTVDTASVAPTISVPAFNPDTAYNYVAAQVAFGPRVPGSPAQKYIPSMNGT